MSGPWQGQDLLQPITGEQPCGEDLEYSQLLSSFSASRVFGQRGAYDPERPVAWSAIRTQALEGLARSKDLRLLTHLGAAALRTDGFAAFVDTLGTAAAWLATYWTDVYPRVESDGDATIRKNALNCFADRPAVIDAVRRLPLVVSRQHGTFTLRDIDIVAGNISAAADETAPDGARLDAAFTEMPIEELQALHQAVEAGIGAVDGIGARMLEQGGIEAVPTLDALSTQLAKLQNFVAPRVSARSAPEPETSAVASETGVVAPAAAAGSIGPIASRQDAIRALDAVADFFRRNEPSSPIPMFVERAKRLVSKNFLEVLADVAPDAVSQAMLVGGVTEPQSE